MATQSTVRRSAETMFPLIEQYLRRSSSQAEFCQRHRLSKSILAYWLGRYRSAHRAPGEGFVELSAPPTGACSPHTLEVVYPNGVKLRLNGEVSPDYLRTLIQLIA